MQQLALMAVMNDEIDRDQTREWDRFKSMLIAMNPDQAKEILEALDSAKDSGDIDGIPEFADGLTDEEMENYEPYSHEEVDEAIDLLRKFGVAIT